jgi:hypothetical protein
MLDGRQLDADKKGQAEATEDANGAKTLDNQRAVVHNAAANRGPAEGTRVALPADKRRMVPGREEDR